LRESPASSPQLVKIQVTISDRPMSPQNFYWTPGNKEVTIYWSPVTSYEDGTSIDGNLYGYELYRSTGNDTPDIPLAILDPEQTSYVDKYIELGQTYHYWIRTVDRNGAKSSFSSPISVILNEPTQPSNEDQYKDAVNIPNPPHPTSVTAINNANGTVTWTLNWETPKYNSDGTTYDDHSYYKIYRADSYEGPYSMLATASSTTYTYTTASANKYYYKLQAVDTYGNVSDLSGAIYLNAIIPSMNQDSLNFRVDNNASTSTSIVLKWSDLYASGADLQSYNVYRAIKAEGPYYKIGSITDAGTERTYTDTNVVQNMTYYYRLTGVNTYGESEFSYYATGVAAKPSYVFEAENGVLIDEPKYPNETDPDIDTSNIQFNAIPGADYSGGWALFYEPGDTTVSPLTDHHFCISALVLPAGAYTVKVRYEKGAKLGNYTISLYGESSSLTGSSFGNLESTAITNFSVNGYDNTLATNQMQEDSITNVVLDEDEQYYLVIYYDGGGGTNVGERGLILDNITFEGQ
jgi:fibronectin type 3 domain-containing protein